MANDTPERTVYELTRLAELAAPARVVEVVLKRSLLAMQADVRDNFDGSHGPDGQPWPSLRHPRIRGGSKPLLDTGLLRASVVGESTRTANSVSIGTNRPGANLHQQGGTIVPVNAKALAIPLTKEALRAGSPRRFGRPLVCLWRHGAPSGVLAEIDRDKQRQSKHEKTLSKSTRRFSSRQRAILGVIKKLNSQASHAATPTAKARIQLKINVQHAKLAATQKTDRLNMREKVALAAKRKASGITVQYALVRSVTVDARPFIGFGPRLVERLDKIIVDTMQEMAAGKLPGGAG